MEGFDVCHLGRVSSFDQGVEPIPYEFGKASAEDGLFSEEIRERFEFERLLECAGVCGAYGLGKAQCDLHGMSRTVLAYAYQCGNTISFQEGAPHTCAGAFGGHHDDIHIVPGDDGLVSDGETVGETEGRAALHIVSDILSVDVGLDLIRKEHKDDVSLLGRICELADSEPFFLGLVP